MASEKLPNKAPYQLVLALIFLLGMTLRVLQAAYAGFTYDEAWTYLDISRPGLLDAFFFVHPANNVLSSFLVSLISLLGENEFILRTPALIASAVCLYGIARLAIKICPGPLSVLFMLWFATQPYFTGYGIRARGYALAMGLFFIGFAVLFEALRDLKLTPKRLLFSAVCFGLTIASIPTFVLPIATCFIALLLVACFSETFKLQIPTYSLLLRFTLFLWIPAIVIAVAFYLGLIGKLNTAEYAFGYQTIVDMLQTGVSDIFYLNISKPVIHLSGLAMFGTGAIILMLALKAKDAAASVLCLSFVLLLPALLIFCHLLEIKYPFSRTWQYFFPLFALMLGYGLSLLPKFGSKSVSVLLQLFIAGFILIVHYAHFSTRVLRLSEGDAIVPIALKELAPKQHPVKLCYSWTFAEPVRFYQVTRPDLQSERTCAAERRIYLLLSDTSRSGVTQDMLSRKGKQVLYEPFSKVGVYHLKRQAPTADKT